MEDYSLEAMEGYILDELSKSPQPPAFFSDGATTQDLDLVIRAMQRLLREKEIAFKSGFYYIPTLKG